MQNNEKEALIKLAQKYSRILSTPFLPQPRISFIKDYLKDIPFEITEDNYSLVITVPGTLAQKLVFMSHLDHPGIILKNRHEGICFGSLFPDRLQKIISQSGFIPFDIYSPDGKFLTYGKLTGLTGRHRQIAHFDIPLEIPPNSVAYYKIGFFKEDKDYLYLYAADNDVPTLCMLNLITNIKTKPLFTLKFVFTFFEEVHQISSFNLARKNSLNLTRSDLVLNLECKLVENHILNPSKSTLNYSSGVILQPIEKDCLYGYSLTSPNLLERLIIKVTKKFGINLQYGLGMGSTDARPFSNFGITPNICTLDVPNPYKHNCDLQGNIVLEKIFKKDIFSMYRTLSLITKINRSDLEKISSLPALSDDFKKKDRITDSKAMKRKMFLNYRLDLAYTMKFSTKKYFPVGIIHQTIDTLLTFFSYVFYFILKVTKFS